MTAYLPSSPGKYIIQFFNSPAHMEQGKRKF